MSTLSCLCPSLCLFFGIRTIEPITEILVEASYKDFGLFHLYITAVINSHCFFYFGAKLQIIRRITKRFT